MSIHTPAIKPKNCPQIKENVGRQSEYLQKKTKKG
jgi:hypothetical protein